MNLPAGVAGAIVSVADYAGTFATNNLTIVPNGSDKIGSQNENAKLSTEGQSVTLVFVDSTQGWINTMDSTSNVRGVSFICASGGTETTSGDYKIHTFNSSATFTVNSIGSGDVGRQVSYVVAAGGGGGGSWAGGGGGAGGFREGKQTCGAYTASPIATTGLAVTAAGFPITVGAGGATSPSYPARACNTNGANSVFSTITSSGGGRGGNDGASPPSYNGGSGGGGSCNTSAGAGNTPPVSPPQGNAGGNGHCSPPIGAYFGGGGGGATVAGSSDPGGNDAGPGGAGATSSITGSPVARAGGGAGGNVNTGCSTGGAGGGGPAGGGDSGGAGTAGTANTGGGGGAAGAPTPTGNSAGPGGVGGSGVVIIRYKFQ